MRSSDSKKRNYIFLHLYNHNYYNFPSAARIFRKIKSNLTSILSRQNVSIMAEEEPIIEDMPLQKISVFTPIIYVSIVIGALILFSIFYRRKRIAKLQVMKPFFPPDLPKEIYLQLKDQDPKPDEKVLKAALIRRGAEAIRRLLKLRENNQYITLLYQKGSIGDEFFDRFKLALKIQELEIQELVQEAETYKQGWAPTFMPVCQEVTLNEALRRRVNAIEDRKEQLAKEWELYQEIEASITN